MIEVFEYEKHAPMVSRWIIKHSFPMIPPEMLPATGFVANGIATGFLYLSDSRVAWIEWVFSDPTRTKEERAEALDMLFGKLEQAARENEVLMLFSASGHLAYSAVLERQSFQKTDEGMSHFVKFLKRGI